MENKSVESGQPLQQFSPLVELRQYTLRPGQRDVLIDLFERAFIEPQEAAGMAVIGQFRDLNDPNRFVWLRGFPDMQTRQAALASFYYGPVWREHRDVANATMVDSDNVLLLRPATPASGFRLNLRERPAYSAGVREESPGLVVATILSFETQADTEMTEAFERILAPMLTESGAALLAYFVTEPSENTFPALPVREGEHVFVWFSGFTDRAAYDAHRAALAQSPAWLERWNAVTRGAKAAPEILKLAPTARSLTHG